MLAARARGRALGADGAGQTGPEKRPGADPPGPATAGPTPCGAGPYRSARHGMPSRRSPSASRSRGTRPVAVPWRRRPVGPCGGVPPSGPARRSFGRTEEPRPRWRRPVRRRIGRGEGPRARGPRDHRGPSGPVRPLAPHAARPCRGAGAPPRRRRRRRAAPPARAPHRRPPRKAPPMPPRRIPPSDVPCRAPLPVLRSLVGQAG